jgi:hypothetical protein
MGLTMTKNAEKAFNELKEMGVPVRSSEGYGDRGYFWISAEEGEESEVWLDYYSNFWGSDKLNAVLDKYGLFFEWYNPAYANVWDI